MQYSIFALMGIVRTTNLKFFFFPLLLAKAQFSLGIDEWQEFTIYIYIYDTVKQAPHALRLTLNFMTGKHNTMYQPRSIHIHKIDNTSH